MSPEAQEAYEESYDWAQAALVAKRPPAMLWGFILSWLCMAMGMEPVPYVFHVSAFLWKGGEVLHRVKGGMLSR
jgi:hypothetical protein